MKFTIFLAIISLAFADPQTTPPPSPPEVPCIVGGVVVCPTGSICTQTMTCGGLCITTGPELPASSMLPLTDACVLGDDSCPTGSTCTQTVVCGGACIATPTGCIMGDPRGCATGSTCTPTMTCQTTGVCGGACIATPTPPPAEIPCTVGYDVQCPTGSTCTPTMTCPATGNCGGACIATPTPPPTPTPTLIPCGHHKPHCPKGHVCKHGFCRKFFW